MEFIVKLLKLCFLLFTTTNLLGTINDDLIRSAKNGDLEQVEDFIKHGANVNAKNIFGLTALIQATRNNHFSIVEYLIEQHKANVNARTNDGETALIAAAYNGHLPIVQYLVERGAHVNAKDNTYWTPLMCAAHNGHLSVVQYLIKHGADVNTANNFGETTLIGAAFIGHLTVIRYLIEHGAHVNAKDNRGLTALTYAKDKNHHNIVALIELCQQPGFEEFRADPSKFMEEQQRAEKPLPKQLIFLWSIILNKNDVFEELLRQGTSPNTCDEHKMTALMYAVITGSKNMVQKLANYGAQIHRENERGENAIQLAADNGLYSITAWFILRQKINI